MSDASPAGPGAQTLRRMTARNAPFCYFAGRSNVANMTTDLSGDHTTLVQTGAAPVIAQMRMRRFAGMPAVEPSRPAPRATRKPLLLLRLVGSFLLR